MLMLICMEAPLSHGSHSSHLVHQHQYQHQHQHKHEHEHEHENKPTPKPKPKPQPKPKPKPNLTLITQQARLANKPPRVDVRGPAGRTALVVPAYATHRTGTPPADPTDTGLLLTHVSLVLDRMAA